MPRGKAKPISTKIEELDQQIHVIKDKLKELETQKQELMKEQKKVEVEELLKTINIVGLSVEEACEIIKEMEKQTQSA